MFDKWKDTDIKLISRECGEDCFDKCPYVARSGNIRPVPYAKSKGYHFGWVHISMK